MKSSVVATVLGLMLMTASALAQSDIDQRISRLEEELRLLRQEREAEKRAAAEKASKPVAIAYADEKGLGIKSADGGFGLRFRGQIKADGRFFLDDTAEAYSDTFLIRSARIRVDGTVFRDFDFMIQPEFAGSSLSLQDAYLEWRRWPELRLRAGKFKSPVSLERLQSDTETMLPELGLATALAPNRDIGLQLGGELWGGVVGYAVGVFNGVADGASGEADFGDSKEVEARLFVHPFRQTDLKPLQALGVGLAGTWGDVQGATNSTALPVFRSAGQNAFFAYRSGTFAGGERYRVVPQMYYYWGRFGLLAEYALSAQEVRRGAASTQLENTAWQVEASVLLTDDVASYRGVSPKRPFDPTKGNWGALEIAGRYNELDVDDAAFLGGFADPVTSATQARGWAVGLNWYLNRNVRTFVTYEETEFDGGAAAGTDRPTEKIVFTRLQLAY